MKSSLILFTIVNIIVVAESSQNFVWNPNKWLDKNENPNATNDISELQESKAKIQKLENTIAELKHKLKHNLNFEMKDKQIQQCLTNVALLNEKIKNEPCRENNEEKRVALTLCTKLSSEYEIKLFSLSEKNKNLDSENFRLSNNLKHISDELKFFKSVVSTKDSEIQNQKSEISDKLGDIADITKELDSKLVKLHEVETMMANITSELVNLNDAKLRFNKTVQTFLNKNNNCRRKWTNFIVKENEKEALLQEKRKKDLEIIQKFKNENKNKLINGGFAEIMYTACSFNAPEVVSAILDLGVRHIDSPTDALHYTCLHYAAYKNFLNLAEMLIERGADLNKLNSISETPLIVAVRYERVDIVKLLLQKNADKTIKDDRGYTAIDFARQKGNQKIIDLFK